MNLQKALLELVQKGGLSKEAESLKKIAEDESLAAIELEPEVATTLNSLMGFEQAKTNFKVKNYFFAQALDGLDKQIATSAKEAGLTEDQVAQIEADGITTGKRQQLLTQFLKDAKPAQSTEAAQRLKEAQDRITALQQEKEAAIKEVHDKWSAEKRERLYDSIVSEHPWGDHYPAKVRKTLFKEGEAELLQKLKGVVVYNEQTGENEARNAADPTLPLTGPDQQPLTYKQFTEMVMRENNYLKTIADNGSGQDKNETFTGKPAATKANNKPNPALEANRKALAEQGVQL